MASRGQRTAAKRRRTSNEKPTGAFARAIGQNEATGARR
jgi:hypothetical protein